MSSVFNLLRVSKTVFIDDNSVLTFIDDNSTVGFVDDAGILAE